MQRRISRSWQQGFRPDLGAPEGQRRPRIKIRSGLGLAARGGGTRRPVHGETATAFANGSYRHALG